MIDTKDGTDDVRPHLSSYRALWRLVPGSMAYLICGFVLSITALTVLNTNFLAGVGMLILVIGLPIVVGSLYAARGFGTGDRSLLHLTGLPEIEEPNWPVVPADAPLLDKLLTPVKSGHYWSYLLHQMLIAPILATITFTIAVSWAATALGGLTYWLWAWLPPDKDHVVGDWIAQRFEFDVSGRVIEMNAYFVLGVITAITLPWVLRGLTLTHHGIATALLGRWPSDDLVTEVKQESAAREAAIHAEDSAMRRLERDLHDGPQQRLVRLQMDLAAVERRVADGRPDEAAVIAREAGLQAKAALDELRALSHGVAPPLLADRGLVAALTALGQDSSLTVTTALDPGIDQLVEPELARGLYFVTAELLTNVAKHSGASTAAVSSVVRYDDQLRLQLAVSDNGRGGASEVPGHGLAGLMERVAGHRGQLSIDSPGGGPTRVEVTVPLRVAPIA